MRPLDPRLLRYASAARWFLFGGAALGLAQTVTTVAFAWLLSQSITLALEGRSLAELADTVGALAVVVIVRAVLVWLLEVAANRGAASVKNQLREQVLLRISRRGPDWLAGQQSARVSTVITTGLDALDNYFARYLPQLLLTAIATPIIVAVMLWQDLASGITVIIVLPLIPVFMILIGQATQGVQRQQWASLQRLSTGFLDLVGGLGTLKIYGRAARQSTRLADITEDYRTRTMKVLRISFLSGFALELAASLSVALVAVSIGLRLVDGSMALGVGLFILLLAPEAFLPIRQVGVQFHAAADGLAAAEDVFGILDDADNSDNSDNSDEADARPAASEEAEHPVTGSLDLTDVTVLRGTLPIVTRLSASFQPGTLSVISGASGVGKSTLVAALQGFVPWTGTILLGGVPLHPGGKRDWLAWAGQRPGLFAGTIAENLALGESVISPDTARRALVRAGAAELNPETRLGVQGQGLSGGQAQRVAVARAMYRTEARNARVLVLDEPSSALDSDAENALITGLRQLSAEGRIVIVISHRPAFSAAADQTIVLRETIHV